MGTNRLRGQSAALLTRHPPRSGWPTWPAASARVTGRAKPRLRPCLSTEYVSSFARAEHLRLLATISSQALTVAHEPNDPPSIR